MRLINCSTLKLEEFFGYDIPRYAILSHTWGDEEVSFAEFSSGQPTTKSGYRKILFTCRQAIIDKLDYAWIDTCCIDKSSSAELSEAINSMFTWYKNSTCCYAYLSDVSKAMLEIEFPESRWFTRGWTLQELLAPYLVVFYDRQWLHLGTKVEHAEWVSKITGIDKTALVCRNPTRRWSAKLSFYCVAKRMSWASARRTTRVEDMAYCLLGIFNINMPLLYGEGDRAFLRLQEEIIRKTNDDSILAWGLIPNMGHPLGLIPDDLRNRLQNCTESLCDILASSPKDFINCTDLVYAAHPTNSTSPFTLTNTGLQIQLPLVPVVKTGESADASGRHKWIGLLSCSTRSGLGFPGILLSPGKRKDNCGTKLERVAIQDRGSWLSTVVIGPRAAAASVIKTATITGFEDTRGVRGFEQGSRQILINKSVAFRDLGYRVKSCTAWNIAEMNESFYKYNPVWDAHAMVLTIEGRERDRDIIECCFETLSDGQDTKFTVFMRTFSNRAIIREGTVFSEGERRKFYDGLEQQQPQDDEAKVMICRISTSLHHVSVEVRETRVYDHRLFEVSLDAQAYNVHW
jgi:hypothetical protein